SKKVDHKAMEEIVGNLPEVIAEMNRTLLREITKEKIDKSLPDNQSPGTDYKGDDFSIGYSQLDMILGSTKQS
ncbi:20964_t:CDS:2, partial [Gigaspora rosea]